jgi:FAD/FMN-containing dehydrogenase
MGTSQAGGCLAVKGGIVLDVTRLNKILQINEDNMTITMETGVTFGTIETELSKKGWKLGVMPEGGLSGTIGGHLVVPGLGIGSTFYGCQGDQVISLEVVLPNGKVINTGSTLFPKTESGFWRYTYGPDLTGLFLGSEGVLGVITKATLKMWALPKHRAFFKFAFNDFENVSLISKAICRSQIAFYSVIMHGPSYYGSFPENLPPEVGTRIPAATLDVFVEGTQEEVKYRSKKIQALAQKYNGDSWGTESTRKYWDNHFLMAAKNYTAGIGPIVSCYIPFKTFPQLTEVSWRLCQKYRIKRVWIGAYVMGNTLEHFNMPFYHENDQDEYQRVRDYMEALMKKTISLGGVPYRIGLQWASHCVEELQNTVYYETLKAIKKLFDPNGIMNPGILGI